MAILFAGFYVEAALNHVIAHFRKVDRVKAFLNGKRHPGLSDKLMWFYNDFMEPSRPLMLTPSLRRKYARALRRHFPGFAELAEVRNDVAHGRLNRISRSLDQTERIRQQAKDIVVQMHDILRTHGHKIRKLTDYYLALQRF